MGLPERRTRQLRVPLDCLSSRATTIFRQILNQVIQAKPTTPTVVEESNREDDCEREQQPQDCIVFKTNDEETEKADCQNYQLGDHHVGQNGANEKAFFPLE
jgi:hypothetical protein